MSTLALAILLIFLAPAAAGAVYKWVDPAGGVHYSDEPPPRGDSRQLLLEPPPSEAAVRAAEERARQLIERYPVAEDAGVERAAAPPAPSAVAAPWRARCFDTTAQVLGRGPIEPGAPPRTTPLGARERQRLLHLFEAAEGSWEGRMAETICRGTRAAPAPELRDHDVYLRVTGDPDGRYLFEAALESPQAKIRREENFWWLLGAEHLRFGDVPDVIEDAPLWDVELLLLEPGVLEFARRHRRRGAAGASVAHVDLWSLRTGGRSMTLRTLSFTGDTLGTLRTWTLHR